MYRFRVVCGIFLVYILAVFIPVQGCGAEVSTSTITHLSYEVIYPDNQITPNLGYFDLQVQAGQEQSISLKLKNHAPSEIEVKIGLSNATTTSNGRVDYGPSEAKKDSSLTYGVTSLVKGPSSVTIPAKGSKQVDFVMKLPKDTPVGQIAGGIQIVPVEDEHPSTEDTEDLVENQFAYLVGLLLRVGDTKGIKPMLKMNQLSVKQLMGKTHLVVNVSNIRPAYLEGMDVSIEVRKANKRKSVFDFDKKNMRMAPNTRVDIPISLPGEGLKAGDYTATIKIKEKEGQQWSWTDQFQLTDLDVNQIRKQERSEKSNAAIVPLIISFMIIVLMGLTVFLCLKGKKRRKVKKE